MCCIFQLESLGNQPMDPLLPMIFVAVQAERMRKMISDLAAGKSYELGPDLWLPWGWVSFGNAFFWG